MSAFADALLTVIKEQHAAFRETVRGLGEPELHWTPGEDTNSLAMLISHICESEGRILRIAIEGERRDPEELAATRQKAFDDGQRFAADDLLALLDGADREAERVLAALDHTDPSAVRTHRGTEGTAAFWVARVVAHVGEHAGNALLTRQLLDARSTP